MQTTPAHQVPWYKRLLGLGEGRSPVEQQIDNRLRGLTRQRWPIVSWTLAIGEQSLKVLMWSLRLFITHDAHTLLQPCVLSWYGK